MMETFTAYIKTITALTVFSVTVGLLMPDGNLRRYTRWILGMLVLMAVLQPLLRLTKTEAESVPNWIQSVNVKTDASFDADLQEKWTKRAAEQAILEEVQQYDANVAAVQIEWEEAGEGLNHMTIVGEEISDMIKTEVAKKYGLEKTDMTVRAQTTEEEETNEI